MRLFDEVIKRAGSKTVLYMTWARKHSPDAQQAIADAYNAIGKEVRRDRGSGRPSLAELSGQARQARATRS